MATSDITGAFQVGQYINDSTNLLPTNSQISNISVASGVTTLTVTWLGNYTFGGTTVASLIANDGQNDNYALLGFKAGQQLTPQISWFIEGRNLTNEKYAATTGVARVASSTESIFLPGDGSSVYGGLQWRY